MLCSKAFLVTGGAFTWTRFTAQIPSHAAILHSYLRRAHDITSHSPSLSLSLALTSFPLLPLGRRTFLVPRYAAFLTSFPIRVTYVFGRVCCSHWLRRGLNSPWISSYTRPFFPPAHRRSVCLRWLLPRRIPFSTDHTLPITPWRPDSMGYRRVTLSAVNSVVTGRTSSADRPFSLLSSTSAPTRDSPSSRFPCASTAGKNARHSILRARGAWRGSLLPSSRDPSNRAYRFSPVSRALSTRIPVSSCRCQVSLRLLGESRPKDGRRANDKRRAICGKGATVVRPVHMCARKHVAESRVRRSKARTPETQFKLKEKERRRRRRRRHSGLSYYTLGGPG